MTYAGKNSIAGHCSALATVIIQSMPGHWRQTKSIANAEGGHSPWRFASHTDQEASPKLFPVFCFASKIKGSPALADPSWACSTILLMLGITCCNHTKTFV